MIYKYSAEDWILQLLFLKTYRKQPNNSSAAEGMFVTFSVQMKGHMLSGHGAAVMLMLMHLGCCVKKPHRL